MRRRARASVAVLGTATLLTMAAPATAVTGGQADTSHPYTVALISATGHPYCSGVWTAIGQSRRVVVTDAHCVSRFAAARVRVFFGRTWTAGARTWSGRSYRHPSFDPNTHRNDVAVIKLDRDPEVAPAVLARSGAATTARHVDVVGFGSSHTGQRRSATEVTTSWSSWRLYLRPGSGNSCSGDSGGPDLLPGTRQIVALTDDGTCSYDKDSRVDQGSARSFILGPH